MPHVTVHDYVNHPFGRVASALARDTDDVIQRATTVASEHASELDAQLHAQIGPVDVTVDVSVEIGPMDHKPLASGSDALRIPITWRATRHPELFPAMQAELRIYPLTSTETQLELSGTYEPVVGAVGQALGGTVLHKMAEASVLQFVQELAGYLREALREPSAAVVH